MDRKSKKLLMRAAGHDPDAFSELIRIQMKNMYRTAYAILSNDADALDAIQDTVLVMWEKLSELKNPKYFRTWYTRILINRCFDIRASSRMEVPLEEWEEPSKEDHYRLEWEEVLRATGEKYRIVMELYYGQGYRTSEIAKMLGVSESTVRTQLQRGRERIKRYYENDEVK